MRAHGLLQLGNAYGIVLMRFTGAAPFIFADFIPIIANDIPIALTYLGSSDMKFKKFNLNVRNFQVEFLDIWTGTLSVDENDRLVRLNMPAQDLEVIRKDLVP